MPLVEIPTWATWTKEWGAGLEIIRGLTGEDLGTFCFSFLSFLPDLKRKGWKTETRVMAWQQLASIEAHNGAASGPRLFCRRRLLLRLRRSKIRTCDSDAEFN